MDNNFIDYEALVDHAMHSVIRDALKHVIENGFAGDQHFFISFLTNYPNVVLSSRLKQRYPTEMTIILQHQFEKLILTKNDFSVVLSFDTIKEKIVIPFESIVAFADPSVSFGLQFKHASTDIYMLDDINLSQEKEENSASFPQIFIPPFSKIDRDAQEETNPNTSSLPEQNSGNIVSLAAYRKKEKKG